MSFLRTVLSLLTLAGTLSSTTVLAQGQLPDVAPLGAAPRPGSGGGQQPPPNMPETHAAPGGADSTLPQGNEPSLPEEPLEVSDEVAAQIGTDGTPENLGTGPDAQRNFYGLYYNEKAGEYRYRVAFPVWAERIKPSETKPEVKDRASLYGGLYYNRRAADHADDIAFPLFWNLRNPLEKTRTTVAGPVVNRRTPKESDDWLLPIYATGKRENGGYTIIPPLLTALHRNADGGLNILGPAFCTWKGGPACDTRTAQDIDLGIAPFYFFGQNKKRRYEVVTPLLHYYRFSPRSQNWLNVYGPYLRQHRNKRDMFHLIPFYWSITGEDERHTTVFPLYHYGYKGPENLLITPLFLHKTGKEDSKTFVTYLYARHRGRTELDMYTPLLWHHRDPRIGLDRKLLFPLLYTNKSPRENHLILFPLYAHKNRFGISESTWVTPLFNYRTHLTGWSLAVNPLAYFGKNGNASHSVLAPLYFDFDSPKARTTIVPPGLFVRHRGEDSTFQLIANTLYRERRYGKSTEWEFHFLPFFSYGKRPSGHWWNVLFGLTGFKREGTTTEAKVLWAPIPLSK